MSDVAPNPNARKTILHLRIGSKDTDALCAFLKKAIPFYEAPGGIRVRLLRNVKDPSRFIEIVEYDSKEAFEMDRRRVDHDPDMKAFLDEWHTLLTGGVEVETYEEIARDVR